jgi:Raf kinase inhibitor-like YbhB/YbcL family protein
VALQRLVLTTILPATVVTAGCGGDQGHEVDAHVAATVTISSTAVSDGAQLPGQFTCDGSGESPPLAWSGATPRAWALVVDDPDAPGGTYTHWVVVDIAAATTAVGSGQVPAGGVEAKNSAGEASYAAPCPPSGEHRYRFTVYGLDAATGLGRGASLEDALTSIGEHATSRGTLTAVYSHH